MTDEQKLKVEMALAEAITKINQLTPEGIPSDVYRKLDEARRLIEDAEERCRICHVTLTSSVGWCRKCWDCYKEASHEYE